MHHRYTMGNNMMKNTSADSHTSYKSYECSRDITDEPEMEIAFEKHVIDSTKGILFDEDCQTPSSLQISDESWSKLNLNTSVNKETALNLNISDNDISINKETELNSSTSVNNISNMSDNREADNCIYEEAELNPNTVVNGISNTTVNKEAQLNSITSVNAISNTCIDKEAKLNSSTSVIEEAELNSNISDRKVDNCTSEEDELNLNTSVNKETEINSSIFENREVDDSTDIQNNLVLKEHKYVLLDLKVSIPRISENLLKLHNSYMKAETVPNVDHSEIYFNQISSSAKKSNVIDNIKGIPADEDCQTPSRLQIADESWSKLNFNTSVNEEAALNSNICINDISKTSINKEDELNSISSVDNISKASVNKEAGFFSSTSVSEETELNSNMFDNREDCTNEEAELNPNTAVNGILNILFNKKAKLNSSTSVTEEAELNSNISDRKVDDGTSEETELNSNTSVNKETEINPSIFDNREVNDSTDSQNNLVLKKPKYVLLDLKVSVPRISENFLKSDSNYMNTETVPSVDHSEIYFNQISSSGNKSKQKNVKMPDTFETIKDKKNLNISKPLQHKNFQKFPERLPLSTLSVASKPFKNNFSNRKKVLAPIGLDCTVIKKQKLIHGDVLFNKIPCVHLEILDSKSETKSVSDNFGVNPSQKDLLSSKSVRTKRLDSSVCPLSIRKSNTLDLKSKVKSASKTDGNLLQKDLPLNKGVTTKRLDSSACVLDTSDSSRLNLKPKVKNISKAYSVNVSQKDLSLSKDITTKRFNSSACSLVKKSVSNIFDKNVSPTNNVNSALYVLAKHTSVTNTDNCCKTGINTDNCINVPNIDICQTGIDTDSCKTVTNTENSNTSIIIDSCKTVAVTNTCKTTTNTDSYAASTSDFNSIVSMSRRNSTEIVHQESSKDKQSIICSLNDKYMEFDFSKIPCVLLERLPSTILDISFTESPEQNIREPINSSYSILQNLLNSSSLESGDSRETCLKRKIQNPEEKKNDRSQLNKKEKSEKDINHRKNELSNSHPISRKDYFEKLKKSKAKNKLEERENYNNNTHSLGVTNSCKSTNLNSDSDDNLPLILLAGFNQNPLNTQEKNKSLKKLNKSTVTAKNYSPSLTKNSKNLQILFDNMSKTPDNVSIPTPSLNNVIESEHSYNLPSSKCHSNVRRNKKGSYIQSKQFCKLGKDLNKAKDKKNSKKDFSNLKKKKLTKQMLMKKQAKVYKLFTKYLKKEINSKKHTEKSSKKKKCPEEKLDSGNILSSHIKDKPEDSRHTVDNATEKPNASSENANSVCKEIEILSKDNAANSSGLSQIQTADPENKSKKKTLDKYRLGFLTKKNSLRHRNRCLASERLLLSKSKLKKKKKKELKKMFKMLKQIECNL